MGLNTLASLLQLVACGAAAAEAGGGGPPPVATQAPARFESGRLDTGFPGHSFLPNLARAADGTVFCAFAADLQAICVMATRDGGRSWSTPVRALTCPRPGYIADPNLLTVGPAVTVLATFVPSPYPPFAKSEMLAARSDDGGRSWSAATVVPVPRQYVCGKTHVPVWLDADTVAMGYSYDLPAEQGRPATTEGGMDLRAGVLLSHDRGQTWTPGGDVHVDVFPIGADEPALVRLANGDLFMVVRTASARPYETRSHDGGRTWDPPQPGRCFGHNSPAALLRLDDGAIMRVWDDSPTNRFPLVAAVSTDECQTWSPARTITQPEPGAAGQLSYQTACYPSVAQAADGSLLVVWWETSPAGSEIGWARFGRNWLEEARRAPPAATVVAFGDSVTRGVRDGVTEYQTFRFGLEQRLRAGGQPVRVLNQGIGGSNTADALGRLDADVLGERPDLVVVMFGINDAAMVDGGPVARTAPRVSLAQYRENLAEIVRRLRAAGAAVVLCTPTPMSRAYLYADLGEYATHPDINYLLRDYAAAAREVAGQAQVPCVELFDLFAGTPEGLSLIRDGNHPYVEGHAKIVEALFPVVRDALAKARPAPGQR